jgi:hypothetical protein
VKKANCRRIKVKSQEKSLQKKCRIKWLWKWEARVTNVTDCAKQLPNSHQRGDDNTTANIR